MVLPEIRARSLPEANSELITLGPRGAVVSIGEPGGPLPYGFREQYPLHLRFEFHDVLEAETTEAGVVIKPPGREDVVRLVEQAPILRTATVVYCHCNAGISRSTAFAFVLRCLWMGPGNEGTALNEVFADRPQADPNTLIVAHADELMGRRGLMKAAMRKRGFWFPGDPR